MTRHYTGKPFLTIRLDPEVLEALKARAEPWHGGAGGVALLVRKLIYDFLGWPMPEQWGSLGRSSAKRARTGRPRGRPPKAHDTPDVEQDAKRTTKRGKTVKVGKQRQKGGN